MTKKTGEKNYKVLSGSAIKLLAVVFMLIDHTGLYILSCFESTTRELFSFAGQSVSWYFIFRKIGRLSFPLFAFLITEGYEHTSNKVRYGLDFFALALVSEIPWNLIHSGGMFIYPKSQNVMFTLLLGYLAIAAYDKLRDEPYKRLGAEVILFALAYVIKADYGVAGFGLVVTMYALRDEKLLQAICGSCLLYPKWIASLAFIPINMYSGKRGFIRGKALKYIFYLIYPAQYLALYFIRKAILG